MRIKDVHDGVKKAFSDWEDVFVNPRFVKQGKSTITWHSYQRTFISTFTTAHEFRDIVENGQYSFQFFESGAVIQLFYKFDNRGRILQNASLSYIAPPGDSSWEGGDGVEHFTGDDKAAYSCPWLRIDYDPESSLGATHQTTHMHISSFPDSRIQVNRLPTPRQFVGLVIQIFYPDIYHEKEQSEPSVLTEINHPCLPHEIADYAFHLSVPPLVNS